MSDPLATHRFAFYGNIETTVDALRIVHAASLGIVPRVQHRLDRLEQKSHIVSGATFVYQTHESGIGRWTGNFSFNYSSNGIDRVFRWIILVAFSCGWQFSGTQLGIFALAYYLWPVRCTIK
jgi:predicted chitinase